MDLFLLPYTWSRHLGMVWVLGVASILSWWVVLVVDVLLFPTISFGWIFRAEAFFLLGTLSAVVAATSVYTESSMRKQGWVFRYVLPLLALGLALVCTGMGATFFDFVGRLIASQEVTSIVEDSSFTHFRYRWGQWASAGLAAGLSTLIVRWGGHFLHRRGLSFLSLPAHPEAKPFSGVYSHIAGGLASGLFGAVVWQILGYFGIPVPSFSGESTEYWIPPDLYLASAGGALVFGMTFGALVWSVPDEMYAGWVRVLSRGRFGHRIPVGRVDGGGGERFLGHYPRGLDLHLPAEDGIAELHASFFSDGNHGYTVRGLSQYPLTVHRLLEKVDLRYDPQRPAPLETELKSEDVIVMAAGQAKTEVEFLMLPREEV